MSDEFINVIEPTQRRDRAQNELDKNPHDPLIGTIEKGGVISDEKPQELDDFLTEFGLIDAKYVCTIKRAPKEGSTVKEHLPGNYKGRYPSVEEIGKKFGSGQYIYSFSYSVPEIDPVTGRQKQKRTMKEYKVYLGSEWDDIAEEFYAEKYYERKNTFRKLHNKEKMKSSLFGEETVEKIDPIENMKNTMGIMRDLGVPIGGKNEGSMDNTQMMMFMMQMMQKSSENMMQMMIASQNNTSNMVQAMVTGRPQQPDTMGHFREMMTMVQGITEAKEIMNPEKKNVVDRIFEMAEGVMPAIMQIAAKPPAERANDPMVGMVKGMPEFKQMDADPEMQAELIRKWDETHGEEQTDVIIATVGWTRPGVEIPQPE